MTSTTDTEPSGSGAGADRFSEAGVAVMDQAARTAEAHASRTMVRASDSLVGMAHTVREAGAGIREQQPQLADLAETAADQVERASAYLREHNATEVLAAAQDLGRRQPAILVGGGLLLGLAIGRLLKTASSAAGTSAPGDIAFRSRATARRGSDTMTAAYRESGTSPAGSWSAQRNPEPVDVETPDVSAELRATDIAAGGG